MTESLNVQQEGKSPTLKYGFACQYWSLFWCDRR